MHRPSAAKMGRIILFFMFVYTQFSGKIQKQFKELDEKCCRELAGGASQSG